MGWCLLDPKTSIGKTWLECNGSIDFEWSWTQILSSLVWHIFSSSNFACIITPMIHGIFHSFNNLYPWFLFLYLFLDRLLLGDGLLFEMFMVCKNIILFSFEFKNYVFKILWNLYNSKDLELFDLAHYVLQFHNKSIFIIQLLFILYLWYTFFNLHDFLNLCGYNCLLVLKKKTILRSSIFYVSSYFKRSKNHSS